jgi:hypothetical protein
VRVSTPSNGRVRPPRLTSHRKLGQNAAALPLPLTNYTPVAPRFPEHEAYNTLPPHLTDDAFGVDAGRGLRLVL